MNKTGVEGAVVVPAVGTAGSLSVVRSLGRHGIHVIAVSEQPHPPSFSSKYCAETASVPDPGEDLEGYGSALLDLARRDDVTTVIPVRESDVYVLAKNRHRFAEYVTPIWPTFDQLRTVHDRQQLFAAADRAGVEVPETVLLDDVDDWDHERIVKGRFAILTDELTESVAEGQVKTPPKTIFLEPGERPDVTAIVDAMGHVPIAQEYVDGTEYCFRGFYHDGEALRTSQKKLVRGYKYSRGPSIFHEAVSVPALERAGRALLDELEWEGIASVGFIRNAADEFKLLEINPRIPASLPMDIHAGVDYPYYYWQLAQGGDFSVSATYRPGTSSHLLRGELVHLYSVFRDEYPMVQRPSAVRTIWDIGKSLLTHPKFDYLSLDDPKPFLRDVLNVVDDLRT